MSNGDCGHALRRAHLFGLQATYALALLLELLKHDQSLYSLLERSPDPLDCGFACVLLPCLCSPALALHGFGGAWLVGLSLGFLWCSAVAKRGTGRGLARGPGRGTGQGPARGRGPDGGRELLASVATLELLTGFATFALAYARAAPRRPRRPRRPQPPPAARTSSWPHVAYPNPTLSPNPNPNPQPQPSASFPLSPPPLRPPQPGTP